MDLDIKWNKNKYKEFRKYLLSLSDNKYKEFNSKIISTKYEMLGIRLPNLRKIAKEISKGDYISFLKYAGIDYYEEVLLYGLILGLIEDLDIFLEYFDSYLDLIDNWGICDSFCSSLKIVNKNKEYFLNVIDSLLKSKKEYKVRVGFVLLLDYYVDDRHIKIILKYLDNVQGDCYYIDMAKAWLLCEVFVKYNKEGLDYLENNNLSKFVINKAISKIRDSYRVDKELKDYILKFKK